MLSIPNFNLSEEIPKSSYQVREVLTPFSNLIALILSSSSTKGFRVTKIVKEMKFEGVRDESVSKKCFQRQSVTKHFTLTVFFV